MKGVLGKLQLSPNQVEKIKPTVFNHYPLEGYEEQEKAWANCVKEAQSQHEEVNTTLWTETIEDFIE